MAAEPPVTPAGHSRPRLYWPAFVVSLASNGALLAHFHRRFWYPPDEGAYAHVAQRLLAGEVLNRDVQDIHPGYINFLNAAALRLFGLDLVSLRYPLVLASLAGACLVFVLLANRRPLLGLVGSLGFTALGTLQFLDPTAHWYCLCLAVVVCVALGWRRLPATGAVFAVGAIVGTLALFRQLTGAFVAVGTAAYLLRASTEGARGKDVLLERLVLAVGAVALAIYLGSRTDLAGWLLLGVWPLLILAALWRTAGTSNRTTARLMAALGGGCLLAAAPLLLYHLGHGSLRPWWHDVTAGPAALVHLPFFRRSVYGWLPMAGLAQVLSGTPGGVLNGVYWVAIPLVGALNGALVLRDLLLSRPVPPLPFLAVFYALVSVHYEVPIYLHYAAGLSLVALLSRTGEGRKATAAAVSGVVWLAAVALIFHAGQPVSRGLTGTVEGRRIALVPATGIPRCGLWIEEAERTRYLELLDVIARETSPTDALLAVPSHAELYFLSGRRNPVRFFNSALGITDERTLRDVETLLRADPPRLVIFEPGDKYNTPFSSRLMQAIKERYALLRTIDGLEIYRHRQ